MTDTGYGQYCPISRALDVLGERWTMLIVRDMLVGTTRFNELSRGLPGLSRSLLTKRLRQLERAGVVERMGGEYLLTDAGRDLEPIVFGIGAWGARWAFGEPHLDELDPEVLVWWMHRRLDTSDLPGRRNVIHVLFTDHAQRFWLVIEEGDASVCVSDPGYDVDVTIRAELPALYEVWLGTRPLREAVRAGSVGFEGPPALTRRMPSVLMLSPVAEIVADARTAVAS